MKNELFDFKTSIEQNNFFKLNYLKIKLTDSCNLRCRGCEYWKLPKVNKLSFEILEKIINEAHELGAKSIHLSGGEPTIRNDLVEIVRLISDLEMKPRLVTNGTLLDSDYLNALIEAGIKGITFSLDSSDEKKHDYMRGKEGLYNKLLTNIALATQRSKKYYVEIGINTVASKDNFKLLPEMVYLANSLSVNWLRFSPIDKSQYTLLGINSSMPELLSENELKLYEKKIKPQIKKAITETKQTVFPENLDIFGIYLSGINEAIKGNYSKSFYSEHICFSPFNHITIFPDGSAMPCCKIPLRNGVIGNVINNSLKEITESSKSKFYREQIKKGNIDACKSCTMKLFDNAKQYELFRKIGYSPKVENDK